MLDQADVSVLLHAAVMESNIDAVRFLLNHGADVNTLNRTNNDDRSIISTESCPVTESSDKVSFSRSASTRDTPSTSMSVFSRSDLYSSHSFSTTNSRRSSLKRYVPNEPRSMTPMHIAAATGRGDILNMLIKFGGSVDAYLENDYTPLVIAILNRNYQVAELLLCRGANVNLGMSDGRTPLHFAVKSKTPALLLLLLKFGADPNLATKKGVTPLHTAIEKKQFEMVEMLLNYGAHVNVKTKAGVTPLFCAVVKGQPEIIRLIFRHGADTSVLVKNGEFNMNLLAWLNESDKKQVIDLVDRYMPKPKKPGFFCTLIRKIWRRIRRR